MALFAPSGAAQLAYQTAGQGFPVVLLHAGIADSRMWAGQVEALRQRYQAVTYDMRGYGQCLPVDEAYTPQGDVIALLDHLGIAQAVLVGCSNGGRIAINTALAYPERVKALIHVNGGLNGFDYLAHMSPQELDLETQIEAAAEQGDLDLTNELEVRLWVDGLQRSPDQVDPAVRQLVAQMNRQALLYQQQGLGQEVPLQPPAAERLANLTLPMLIVTGTLDTPSAQACAEYILQRAPQARQVLIPDTAHLPNLERPAEFNQAILEFLEQVIP
jgi:pimeloyl-ACP methyl ester carboxylesterase